VSVRLGPLHGLYYSGAVSDVERLLSIMARLRDPAEGCAWDREQRFETIAPYTIEEAYEVDDAIRRGDLAALREELGDLLLQVVFHAQMASEQAAFDFADVVRGLCDKLVHRHPNVFSDQRIGSAAEQTRAWEDQKAAERELAAARQGRTPSALDGVTLGLPALARAHKLLGRASRAGFRWPDAAAAFAKLREEVDELEEELAQRGTDRQERAREELGDVLLAAAGVARELGVDPEEALRGANARFERRFRDLERAVAEEGGGIDALDLAALLERWERAKLAESR
jgi:nucleoside triphosphate diphosphatase